MSNDEFYADDVELMDGFHEIDEDEEDEFGDDKLATKKKSDDGDDLDIDDVEELGLLDDTDVEEDLV